MTDLDDKPVTLSQLEDLRQEYVVSNEQIGRLEKKISSLIH